MRDKPTAFPGNMPTHSLLPFVNSPDGHSQDFLLSNSTSIPGAACGLMQYAAYTEKTLFASGGGVLLSCMFCDQTFAHQDELGPHVLTQHPTTFSEPAVLKVEAEFRIPGERPPSTESCSSAEKEETHSCIVCGLISQDAAELESHMRKHKEYFAYCCNVCGRRFRESWFLKNHMKMHTKVGGKGKAQQDLDPPVSINDIIQDSPSEPVAGVFKMCKVCGFIFPDHDSLVEHSKIHNRDGEPDKDRATEFNAERKESFFQGLNLQPQRPSSSVPVRTSKWVPQLNPFITYQAWQLATKGKVAVGPNTTKETGQEVSTDHEDSGSDKEDLSSNVSEGHGDKLEKKLLGRERQAQPQPATQGPDTRRRSLIQKDKDRPTTCEDCQRTFRTYHQLVLHSRVHKREKNGADGPLSAMDAKQMRTSSPEQLEDGVEEGFDETLISGDDGPDHSRGRSKQCSYCRKSFRSSYYLTIHLRTHTGEKPYKCVYCDYAAAQKTSLKYHLDRRHKGQTMPQSPSRPASSASSSSSIEDQHADKAPAPNRAKLWVPAVRPHTSVSPQGHWESKHNKSLVQVKTESDDFPNTSTSSLSDGVLMPVSLKMKHEQVKTESFEAPLNLSLKVSFSIAASTQPAAPLIPVACSFCAFKSMYPEVLIMHKNLVHKDKSDGTRRSSAGGGLKPKRFTGCPPALDGKDVAPLLMIDRRHPRRTKSPPPQPAKPKEKVSALPPKPPDHVLLPDVVQESVRDREKAESQPSQEASRYRETVRRSSTGTKYVMEGLGMMDRSLSARGGPMWHCLSAQFGSLPQIEFGEPSSKKIKYSVPTARDAKTGDKPAFRGPALDGSNRLLLTGRSVRAPSRGAGLGTAAEALQSTCPPVGAALECSDWSMMNFLHSYTPDLAALYHSTAPGSSHGGLLPPRPGSRAVLYQHLPSLPGLQRRDPSASFSNLR